MRIAFAHHEPIDPGKARWVAIVRTLASVAALHPVHWFTPDTAQRVQAYATEHLGLSLPPTLHIQTLPSVHKLAGLTINHVFFRACRKAVAKAGADVLWLRSDKLAAHFARRVDLPLVYEAHLVGPLWAQDGGKGLRQVQRLETLESQLYAGCAGVAAITQGLLDEVRARYAFSGPAAVVPSAVDTNVFKPTWQGGDGKTVAYVGTLQFWKGLCTLLEAIAMAPSLRLLIVGGGSPSEEATLRARIADLKLGQRVELAGRLAQPQIPARVAHAACAVHPLPPEASISARFTSPLKLFEYMAMGLPIVAADVPSTREVLTDSANALLYSAGKADALAAALVRLATDHELSARLSTNALKGAPAFSYEARAQKLAALFAQV